MKFVEERVRLMNHPIFGRLLSGKVKDVRGSRDRCSFGINANDACKKRELGDPTAESKPFNCPLSNVQWQPYSPTMQSLPKGIGGGTYQVCSKEWAVLQLFVSKSHSKFVSEE